MTDSIETSMNELFVEIFCIDKVLKQTMKEFKEGKLEYGDENFEEYQKEMNELKKKWEITIDIMMIIGKYFETNIDYIHVMKLCKRYEQLTQMYHFNPISDCSIFSNI